MQLQISDALVAFIETDFKSAFPAVPLITCNAPFDWNNPPKLIVQYEVEFNWGKRISISGPLKVRVLGFIYVTARAAPGTGTRPTLALLDWFSARLGEAVIPTTGYRVVLQAPRPEEHPPWNGWGSRGVKFSFSADPT